MAMVFAHIETEIDLCEVQAPDCAENGTAAIRILERLLRAGESVFEEWVRARDLEPTEDEREGFRLLALHRQGSKGEPSFNACRETCRELCYYYNLVTMEPDHPEVAARVRLAVLVTRHLYLFVSGKMQVENLGEFCCSSRPVRSHDEAGATTPNQQSTADAAGT
ncbi:MAG: hypothetical protein ACR2OV_10125 [Hyphomicrobiaceae bacterium]